MISQSVFPKLLTMMLRCDVFLLFFLVGSAASEDTYTAAILEHVTIFQVENEVLDRSSALQVMMKNLAVYAQRAEDAKHGGADIIVFPEDGLYGFEFVRDTILPYLEDVPDPKALDKPWNPCKEPHRFGNQSEVLQTLSCIALNQSIAVVANMGDVKRCNDSDPHCPQDGRYQFNTDVAFDVDGTLLARYHKEHLYGERQFNTPTECEHVTFDTSFNVRFGVFTCFDILFTEPAISLVEKYGVQNIVFPTAWMNALPLLSAVQFQQAWSRATCTNLLAANQHVPIGNMYGSGIYSCGDINAYVYDDSWAAKGHLLITKLPKNTEFKTPPLRGRSRPFPGGSVLVNNMMPEVASTIFNGTMFNDVYTFANLEDSDSEGSITACNAGLCCQANYTISTVGTSSPPDRYVLGAFSGHHSPDGFFLQVCALIKCASYYDTSCGLATETSTTVFESISMNGDFSANTTVFPELLGNGIRLAHSSMVKFDGKQMVVNGFKEPLVSAVLFGRQYSQDKDTRKDLTI